MEDEFDNLGNILALGEFSLGDADSMEICREMIKSYIVGKNLNIAEEDLVDLIIHKSPILVYDKESEDIIYINNLKEYKEKILNGKKTN